MRGLYSTCYRVIFQAIFWCISISHHHGLHRDGEEESMPWVKDLGHFCSNSNFGFDRALEVAN